MTADDELESYSSGDNTMLREAIDAIRKGDHPRARDLLTRLLKADQKNATYWLWLSTVVETGKERIYCLETVLRLDPENATARRGLVLMGARPPDESVRPFPLNRPRPWEKEISIPREEIVRKRPLSNPLVRIFAVLGLSALLVALFAGGYAILNPQGTQALFNTPTHRATFTISLTPSHTPVYRTPTPTFLGATPLSHFLQATYTNTPIYALTEHPMITASTFKTGLRFLEAGQYETARIQFEIVLDSEPDAADVMYFIGESYRLEGTYEKALQAYQEAIMTNPGFAPSFLGRALTNLARYPNMDILSDLDYAVSIDPHYAEAYITRGWYQIEQGQYRAAIPDLETAIEISPGSALAWMYLAEAQVGDGKFDQALESALKANQLDLTLIPDYLILAQAYIGLGEMDQAVAVLQTYTIYRPDDINAFRALGTAYNAAGDYESAVVVLSRFLDLHSRDAEAYFQRGTAYLNMGSPNLAEDDFKRALGFDPYDFDSHLGVARAYYDQGLPGDAYVYCESNAVALAKTNVTKAQVYYWEAVFLEEIDDPTSRNGATNSWYRLLALPEDVMPPEWRQAAYQHLGITPTWTPSPTRSRTPTPQTATPLP